MATVVFGALGTLVGGPLGGAIGSLLGNQLDHRILGATQREGPRLKELAVSSSSYGQPIARLHGATRAAGTIFWATVLRESSETSGGKGQPKTTRYSYSVSLAVALSSRPIERIGRIWADGNLLRGEAGDLKTAGTVRIHSGHADQDADPLLSAALGAECPAHRGLAYVVFEDLALGDFGNRIPALSFEVFASGGGEDLPAVIAGNARVPVAAAPVPEAAPVAGYALEGGTIAEVLSALGGIIPLLAGADAEGVTLRGRGRTVPATLLPSSIAWADGEFGKRSGRSSGRSNAEEASAIRYYDRARDYQPGLQRAHAGSSRNGVERVLELPVTLDAGDARSLIEAARVRSTTARASLNVRVATLDPSLAPGALVTPGDGSHWRVESWEWREGGVELGLGREPGAAAIAPQADPGAPWRPADRLPGATLLDAFELPWDGRGSPDVSRVHVALGATSGRWSGASLYVERDGALVPLGVSSATRAVTGTLVTPLGSSPALFFEPAASLDVLCDNEEAVFTSVGELALASGANRLLVGEEIVQFMSAEPLGGARWRLSGLLRGRGATEAAARQGPASGARAVLLDERLLVLEDAPFDSATERVVAIGQDVAGPVFAGVASAGRSQRPLAPVHGRAEYEGNGTLNLAWTRRARGAWIWSDGVDTPLVEESERYEVGVGPEDLPVLLWQTDTPEIMMTASDLEGLAPGTPVWVRQVGRHARSDALIAHIIP